MTSVPKSTVACAVALDIPEILEHILSYLYQTTLFRAARVCRRWCHASRRFYNNPLRVITVGHDLEKFHKTLQRLPSAGSFHWSMLQNHSDALPWIAHREVLDLMDKENVLHGMPTISSRSEPFEQLLRQPLREFHFSGLGAKWETVSTLFPHLGTLMFLQIWKFGMGEMQVNVVLRSCPQLERLHLEKACVVIPQGSTPLSSLDLAHGAQSPLKPTPADETMQLRQLTLRQCQVAPSTMVDVIAVCPQLLELELISTELKFQMYHRAPSRAIDQEEFLSFLSLACLRLRQVHYSTNKKSLQPRSV